MNIGKLAELSQDALNRCKTRVVDVAKSYWLTWTFRTMVFTVCSQEIGTSIDDDKIKREVIQHFIDNELGPELSQISNHTRLLGVPILFVLAGILYYGWKTLVVEPSQSLS